MSKRKHVLILLLALVMASMPMAAFAQEATPEPEAPVVEAEAVEIAIGDEVDGEVTEDVPQALFTFEGEAGQGVSITLVSEDFDTYLVLLDAEGEELETDDDSAGSLDSRISGFTLPDNGTYTIVATSYSAYRGTGTAEGAFTLSLVEFEVARIEYSQTVEGELTADATSQEFRFVGQAGDVVIITHRTDEFDSYLYLDAPDGQQLAYNDDGGGNLDSLIGPLELPETGEYTIRASSYSGSSVGTYELSLMLAQLETIEYGTELTVDLAEGGMVYLQFEANTGDVIDVLVDSDIDPFIALNDQYNYQLISDDDSGSGRNPEITGYVLNSSGQYTLLLSSNVGDSGPVTVEILRAELPSLNEGAQEVTFSENVTQRTLAFTPEAGVTYTVTVTLLNGGNFEGVASPSVDIRQDDFSTAYFSASSVSAVSGTFTADSDSDMLFIVSEYSYSNTTLEVTITAAE